MLSTQQGSEEEEKPSTSVLGTGQAFPPFHSGPGVLVSCQRTRHNVHPETPMDREVSLRADKMHQCCRKFGAEPEDLAMQYYVPNS